MKNVKEIVPLLFIGIACLYTWYVWDDLPFQIPTHFDMEMNPNGWTKKGAGLYFLPLFSLIPFIVLTAVQYSISDEEKQRKTGKMLFLIKCFVCALISSLHIISLQFGLGKKFDFSWMIFVFIGLIFTVLGNYMNHLKQNNFVGVRTTWTLNSEVVWKKTHQYASKFYFYGGLLLSISGFFVTGKTMVFLVFPLLFIALFPVWKSYQFHKEELKNGEVK